MEARMSEEQNLIEYECSDGSQVIITTGDAITFEDCDISTLRDGTQVIEFLHRSVDEDGNIIIHATAKSSTVNIDEHRPSSGSKSQEESHYLHSSAGSDSENEYHKCNECGVNFLSKEALRLHSTVHVDEAFYACEFCSASKIHWTEMWQHQCSNVETAPLVCPQCLKTVSTKKQLQVHEEVHELQQRFTSKRMEGYFKRKLQEAETPGTLNKFAKQFICGVCGKTFEKLYQIEYHEKLHTGERPSPNKCDKCGITYINRFDLTKHTALGCSSQFSRKTDAPFRRK